MPPQFPDRYRYVLLALLVAAVFANSFWGVFVFDEYSSITKNDAIRYFWPPDCIFKFPNFTRPVVTFTFAVNYAMNGLHLWSYHLFNIAIHVISAVTLYAIALRTFLTERLKTRYGRDAVRLAFLIALIWAVHPLQTASVTYVVQRCESMMGMFFLLTLYCTIRAQDSVTPDFFKIMAIVCCALGMGSKQVMITAPVVVLLYDRTFLSGSFVKTLINGRWFYTGLFATTAIVIGATIAIPTQDASAGFKLAVCTPYHYLLTQCAVIPHYIKLAFWPRTLCLDYLWPFVESPREVWPGIVFLATLALASLYGTLRNTAWGFIGAWFFIILAPSSSIMPIKDPAFEHRMYLPLLTPVVAFVMCAYWIARRLLEEGWNRERTCAVTASLFLFVTLALSVRTIGRNCDYYSESAIWRKVAALYPHGERATHNFGNALAVDGFNEEAAHWFEECLKISPDYADAHFNLGVVYSRIDKNEESVAHYKRALQSKPDYPTAHGYMADVLVELKRFDEAIEHYQLELKSNPSSEEFKKKLDDARAKWDGE